MRVGYPGVFDKRNGACWFKDVFVDGTSIAKLDVVVQLNKNRRGGSSFVFEFARV